MKKKILLLYSIVLIFAAPLVSNTGHYAVMKLDSSVNPISSEYLVQAIEKANREKAQFIVMQLDTPGGVMISMNEIIEAVMESKVPVVVYTYPKGAQAASAGGFIMLSSHIAVMAPATRIGAMHPVSIGPGSLKKKEKGDSSSQVSEMKILNDTVASARSLAQKRNRNVAWAEKAVRKAISSTYKEALAAGIIDFIATDMDDLLKKLHNRKVNMDGKTVVLNTRGISAREYIMDWRQKVLNPFANPQVMMLLFIIAIVGIGMEFKNPGMIVPGAIGGLSLIMFTMVVRILPVNIFGLILIILAIVLFILELKITSYGLLTIGGIVSFVIGAMILFDSPLPGGHIPISTIIATLLAVLAFVFIAVRAVINVHQGRVTTGKEGLVGEVGEAMIDFQGRGGKVLVHGEIWNAISEETLAKKDEVVVTAVKGMNVIVKKHVE